MDLHTFYSLRNYSLSKISTFDINKYQTSCSFIKLTQFPSSNRIKLMKSELSESPLTDLQSLILQLSTFKLEKVDQTFVALCADEQIDQLSDKEIQEQNEQLMGRFSLALLGKVEHDKSTHFQQLTVQNASFWSKQVRINEKSIRLIFLPYAKYDLEKENGAISYKKMVLKFFFFNKLLKPEMTPKKTLISVSYMQPPQLGPGGKPRGMKLIPHMEKTMKDLKKQFNLDCQEIKSKIVFVIDIQARRQDIIFNDQIKKENKIYVLTSDETSQPLYALDPTEESISLKTQSTDLLKKVNYVDTAECHLHFNYNQFVNFKPKRNEDTMLANKVSDQIWAVMIALIRPIYKVKQQIYRKYHLETEAVEQPKGNEMPDEYPKENKWKSEFEINTIFKNLNEIFGFKEWKQHMNEPCDEVEDTLQVTKAQKKRLVQFTELIDLNVEFINQEEKFSHAIIMDQLNQISEELKNQSHNMETQSDLVKRYLIERKILEFSKIIVRFLASLKNHKLFSHLLTDYESKFYEHLLTVYSEAHDQFCWATKKIYGKLFNLSEKIFTLRSSKKQMLKVLKKEGNQQKIETKSCSSVEETKKKKKMLEILLNLLEQNRSNEKEKEIEKKILLVKWDLAMTLKNLAVSGDFGNAENQQLKEGLRIVFDNLYKRLFYDSKTFASDYPDGVGFTELQLLTETSGMLKALGRIDLSIEIEKKQGNNPMVENYYNRWLMKYRKEMGDRDVQKIREILYQAIKYFKARHLPEKVENYYNLLIQTGRNYEEKKKFDTERLDYENELNDLALKKKSIEAARKAQFPLTKTTVEEILKQCSAKEKPKSLISPA